ncbi:unnamed protein product [Rotaria sordida]|uniref:Protein translocase subunit SecA n=1 Tax=Rotaria sordida TaxID=392033 RepID=A0A818YRH6_9BILA|nr:unnamed protein product [Rotaria sordida]
MIADIFLRISKKQVLHDNAIEVLMQCIDDQESVEKKILNDTTKNLKNLQQIIDTNKAEENRGILNIFKTQPLKEYENYPGIIADIAKRIYDSSIIHIEKLQEIISSEVNEVRLAAVSAIYNSTIRNQAILNNKRLEMLKKCQNDSDKTFTKWIIKILTLADNNSKDYKDTFKTCLINLENNVNTEESGIYIYQQSNNNERCKELFNEAIISRISNLFEETSLNEKTKQYCCMTINNYLKHSYTNGLNRSQLEHIIHLIDDQIGGIELKIEALTTIKLTVEKEYDIPEFIIEALVKTINDSTDKFTYYVTIVLEIISRRQTIPKVDRLSIKLLDDWVIVEDDDTLIFEKSSQNNSDCHSVSSIVANIFINSLENNIELSEQTLKYLAEILSSNNKQTRILSGKSLYLATKSHDINNNILVELREHIHDDIHNVCVYSTVAYARGLAKLSSENEPIMTSHIEFLSIIYVFDNLQLDNENFTDEVNENILLVLLNESKKQKFEDNIFQMFDRILTYEEHNRAKIIEIIDHYSANPYSIPEQTIFTLDKIIEIPDIDDQIFNILKNTIDKGQAVGENFLRMLADNLDSSDLDSLRNESFELLNKVDNNQDISDELFNILELERTCISIMSCSSYNKDDILYLCEKTKEGQKLTINGLRVLSNIIDSPFTEDALFILMNILNNKQAIPNDIVDKLVEEFNREHARSKLIEIFDNLIRNNQNIPNELLIKLEKALDNKFISNDLLSIFVFQGQKGEKLSINIMIKILDTFLSITNQSTMEEHLSYICSLIEKEDFFKQVSQTNIVQLNDKLSEISLTFDSRFQKALIHGLEKGGKTVVSKSINGFKTLISLHKIRLITESINALLNLIIKPDCDQDIRKEINNLLNDSKLDYNQMYIFKLSNLNDDFSELLDELDKFTHPKLLQRNFSQLDTIINNCPTLINKALEILLGCSNKENISDKLLNSITHVLKSTTKNDIKSLCLKLIVEIVKLGRRITNEMISLIIVQDNTKEASDILQIISRNQSIPKEFQDHMNLLLQIDNINNSNSKKLCPFLKSLRVELEKGLILSDSSIEKLFSIEELKNNTLYDFDRDTKQELVDILALLVLQDPTRTSNPLIVENLEKAIYHKKINYNILNAYQQVIKTKRCTTTIFNALLDVLVKLLEENNQFEKLHLEIFACIVLASEFMNISKMNILEKFLSNKDSIIRRWSYRGLRAAFDNKVDSSTFNDWYNHIIDDLKKNLDIEKVMLDLDLFETITALPDLDYTKIRDKPQTQWNRELIIFDLLKRFEISDEEKFSFYATCLSIENYGITNNNKDGELLKLVHRASSNNAISFHQCYDGLQSLLEIDFEHACEILLISKNPFLDLQKEYIKHLIYERLSNKDIDSKYIDKLALNMISKFGMSYSEHFLSSLKNLDNLKDLKETLEFANEKKVNISDMNVQDTTIAMRKRSLEIKFLCNKIEKIDHSKLSLTLRCLLEKWTLVELEILFNNLEASNNYEKIMKEECFVDILEILLHYKISSTSENHERILLILKKPVENWLREINTIAVENNSLKTGHIKSISELISELEHNNSTNQDVIKLIRQNLFNAIEKIKKSDFSSQIIGTIVGNQNDQNYIAKWTKDQIKQWANQVKNHDDLRMSNEDFIIEALAVIKQAYLLDSDFHLTDAQILSSLIILNANYAKGRLLQVRTGEGKSTIISALAVIYALKGKNVDIITSSPVLAERDAKEKAKFYSMFDIQCSSNNDKSSYLTGPKACYKKQIVYGEVAQFQFDTLRTEYAQLNTLADRKYEVAIVDEVDSMFIDDNSKIARLATNVAGMDQLQPIYHRLWNELVSLQDRIIEIENKFYLFDEKLSSEGEITILEYTNKQGQRDKIYDLEKYIKACRDCAADISHIGKTIPEENLDVFIKKYLEDFITKYIKEEYEVTKHLVDFVNTQISKWVDNVILAYNYQENVHYVVQEGLIKPVDYYSTGIVQNFSHWTDGLHQFLQIKHNLKMTSETLTTNFLSNIGYFKRYKSNLFGLTGTLGSKASQDLLVELYNVDLVIIPSSYRKQYMSLPDIITKNNIQWFETICRCAINESHKGRGTLIICETIEHCKRIAEKLRKHQNSGVIKLYTMNNMNQEENVAAIKSGEIIIATNLAGRGTDIKTDDVEQYGGLHIILTFMPPNKRILEQALGRTARQGKRGTGQIILNINHSLYNEDFDIEKIAKSRDEIEIKILNDFKNSEWKIIQLKDELFFKFCSLLSEIRKNIREKNGLVSKIKNKVKDVYSNVIPSIYESNILLSIEEQWAMFLRKIDNEKSSIISEKIHQKYEKFQKKVIDDYEKGRVIKNPYYHIVIANDLVINDSSSNENYDEAMEHYNRAIPCRSNR